VVSCGGVYMFVNCVCWCKYIGGVVWLCVVNVMCGGCESFKVCVGVCLYHS